MTTLCSLQSLIIRSCVLNEGDLRAYETGKLPDVKHLDVLGNDLKKILELLTLTISWKSVKCGDWYFSG